MTIQKYLVINNRGSARIVERVPALKGNEVAMRLELSLPDELFQRPIVKASISIPKTAVPQVKLDATVTDNVQRIIQEVTGLEMHVTVVEAVEEKDPLKALIQKPRRGRRS